MDRSVVVLVTGLSGAGKTSSMAVLEDLGYHCIDHLPTNFIEPIIEDIENEKDPRYKKLALSVSAVDFRDYFQKFKNSNVLLKVLFLDASKEVLLSRYQDSHRHHPLLISNMASTLDEAIDAEVDVFSDLKSYATMIVDTSYLSFRDLKSRIQRFFTTEYKTDLSISFISFTYRKGVPLDADLVFDIRFLNIANLDNSPGKDGNSPSVYQRIISQNETKEYLYYLRQFLDFTFEKYHDEARHHVTVAIGCTNGKNRSVALVNNLAEFYGKKYRVFKTYRDLKDAL